MKNSFILWLPSWYPNKIKPYEGDFIQRHAQAAALYNTIYVIKIVSDEKGLITNNLKIEISHRPNLVEQIIYLKKSPSFFGRVSFLFKGMRLYAQAIKDCIRENGSPCFIHIHVITKISLLALWIKKKFKIPFLVSEHWTIYQPGSSGEFVTQNFFFKYLVRKIVKGSLALLTVSEDLGIKMQKLVYPKNYIVVPNVVNEEFFYYRTFGSPKFRFVHISTMDFQKNVEAIVDNFALVHKDFSNVELVLVGPFTERLYEMVKNKGLLNHSVFFRGEIPYYEVAGELQQSNALVLYSRFENQPCVIIESLCCGVPVISSAVGGISEVVNHTNGILVSPAVSRSLADAMKQMIKNYHFNHWEISIDARNKFSYSKVGKRFDEIYNFGNY